jgi:spore maturation protein CgeB
VGEARRRKPRLRVLFHDTHHRTATAPEQMDAFDLSGYDGVLAFGEAVARRYRARGHRVWVWHEAADTTVFRPLERAREGDLVWIGNWGDDERTQELQTYLLDPARTLGLRGSVYGVRYPEEGRRAVAASGLRYRGRIPNHRVPEAFARHAATMHVPRRAYVRSLPGVPTIRVFEALACAIPLVCSPWEDSESLFTPGEDFLVARDCEEMTLHLKRVTSDEGYARSLAARGRRTIEARHTCAHRVDELMAIVGEIT